MPDRRRARAALDAAVAPHRTHPTPRPVAGWVRAVRDALGMSTRDLAARMGVASSSWVSELERNEAAGTVTLATLERAAAALGCRLEYVLVPVEPLEEVVRTRARDVARRELSDVEHTMALEAQPVDLGDRVEDRAAQLVDRRGLWADR